MAEIDPVILELRADLGKYRADLRSTTAQVERLLEQQTRDAQRLEAQMKRSTDSIGSSFRSLAASLAAAFSLSQIQQLADGYTRFTNQLKVTGLEGEALAGTQEKLFQIAQQYGTELEAVGSLYSRAAQSSAELNATEGQLLATTEAVAASLKISGTSASQAQGALLQLGQALGSPRIQAEEFNSLLDTMQPLLREVAKRIDGTGGTIGGLTRKIKDLKGEGVSNVEFFRAINDSLADLQKTAAASTLTLGNSFTVLNNALGKYIGEADESLSATEQLSGAIIVLSNNLDTIIPALAAIVAIIGVQYVAAAARATAANIALAASATGSASSMGVLGAATFALQARMAGAATSMQAAAFAARGLGGSLLALAGGPYGAIIALGAGLAYVISTTNDAAQASAQYQRQQEALRQIQERTTSVTEALAAATGKARREALANAKALREETRQYLANAQAALIAAAAKAAETRQNAKAAAVLASGGGPGEGVQGRVSSSQERFNRARRDAIQADADARAAEANVIASQKELARLTKIIDAAAPPAVGAVGGGEGGKPKASRGAGGPSAADVERRFQQELFTAGQQALSARLQMATNAQERAEIELRAVENARRQALNEVEVDQDYSAAQKARIRDALDNLAEIERASIERDRQIQLFEEAQELADAELRSRSEALRQQYDLAKSQAERRRLAFEIIDLEYRERDAALERIKNNEDLADAVRQRAAIEQAALREAQGRTKEQARRDTAGPLENYFDNAKKDAAELNELYESIAVDGLQSLNDGLADAIVNSKSLGDVFKNVAKQIIADLIRIAIQQQIVNALASAFNMGGGGFPGTSGGMDLRGFSIPGLASGGYAAPHSIHRVNEHKGGVELLRMGSRGGTVIPLGQVNQRVAQPAAQSGGVTVVRLALSGDIDARIDQRSASVAVEVVRATAGEVSDLGAQKALTQLSTPRL